MKKFYDLTLLSLLFLFPLFSFASDENLQSLSLQAEALAEARDYAAASQIYEKFFTDSLPNWQKERILYNLGTLRLSQHQPIEALNIFQKINIADLSLPRFGRNLLLNAGIAYVQYAQSLDSSSLTALTQQALFITQSFKVFDQAQQLECQEQKEESAPFCISSFLLNQWMEVSHLELQNIRKSKQQNWLKQSNRETLASFLRLYMQNWIDSLKTLTEKLTLPLFSYFQHQADTFQPIWQELQQKEFSIQQKASFEKAMAAYLSALQALETQDRVAAVQQWEQSMAALIPLGFSDNQNLHDAQLSYDLLLLQESLTLTDVNKLLKQVDMLNVASEEADSLKQTRTFLQSSVTALQAQHPHEAQFFFIAGYRSFQSLIPTKNKTPAVILQQALDQANRILQLSFLIPALPKETSEHTQGILTNQQAHLLAQVTPFIPAVLKEQDFHFHQAQEGETRCQQTPWDQVIPLYDRGLKRARSMDQQFRAASFNIQSIIANQVQMMKDWEQALHLLLHPPQSASAPSLQKWSDTFRLIQEMYLQDQSKPDQAIQELHAW